MRYRLFIDDEARVLSVRTSIRDAHIAIREKKTLALASSALGCIEY
jgi:hypothetical protein|tara:strand:+ start:1061 stop:1198 length:138 start_codon:yes stop_codon:yes gene_type:complete